MSNNSKSIKHSSSRSKSHSSPGDYKLNVVLDIDETLVYFIKKTYIPSTWDEVREENKKRYSVIHTGAGIFVLRPHLKEFLEFLFEHCTVSLWTWSDEEYAFGIADMIKDLTGSYPLHVLHDEHAEASAGPLGDTTKGWGHSKDLNMLWYGSKVQGIKPLEGFHECNTILVDDLPSNSINNSNYRNSITIAPFGLFGEVKDRSDPYLPLMEDDSLLQTMELLKKVLEKLPERCKEKIDENTKSYEVNIFSDANIKFYGIKDYVKKIRYDRFEKRNGRKVSIGYTLREAIAVGKSHLIHEGGGKRIKTRRLRRRTNRRRLNKTIRARK